MIPIEDFGKWAEQIRRRARGCGLYALYERKQLVYVGLTTQSLRARINTHIRGEQKHFTHFSVFLVTGTSKTAQARRIRDLEALLLKIRELKPKYNKIRTNFVAARKLARSTAIPINEE